MRRAPSQVENLQGSYNCFGGCVSIVGTRSWSLICWFHNWQDCESKTCITDNTTWLFYSVIMTVHNSFVRFMHPQHSQYFNHLIVLFIITVFQHPIYAHNHAFYWLSTHILLLKHYLRIIQFNLWDRDNLWTKDKRPVPKVSFVRRFNCSCICRLLYIQRSNSTKSNFYHLGNFRS